MQRQIIALGGGGFSMEFFNPLMDSYILAQSSKPFPKICFLPTASGDADGYVARFHKFFQQFPCKTAHLSLFSGHTNKIESFLLEQDIIYVGGGNTRNLMVLWKEWGLDKILWKAYQQGTILCGISAGSLCWFEEGLTDSIPLELNRLECLGFLKGSNSPHFDGESNRRPRYIELMKTGIMKPGIAADDGVALHYINEQLGKVVASRKNVGAYQFKWNNGTLIEQKINAEFLGK